MKARTLIFVLLLLGAGSFWITARTDRSTLTTAFGTSSVNSLKSDAYLAAAATALDRWLTGMGCVSAPAATPWAGVHSGTESTKGYQLAGRTSRPLLVLVTLQTETASGINVSVFWEFSGFRWNAEKDKAAFKETVQEISRWWKDYQRSHPEP